MMGKQIRGSVENVLVMAPEMAPISTRVDDVEVTWEGFAGDKHAGLTVKSGGRARSYLRGSEIRNTRQVSIVSREELVEVAAAMGLPQMSPDWIGANLLLAGIPSLTLLPIGTRLVFAQDAVLVVEGENLPCTSAGKAVQQQFPEKPGLTQLFPKAALHKRGVVAWVERQGRIREGDEVVAHLPEQAGYAG